MTLARQNVEKLRTIINVKDYGAASKDDGITAAREAYNASLPPATPPEE